MSEEILQVTARKELMIVEKHILEILANYDKPYFLHSRVKSPFKLRLKLDYLRKLGNFCKMEEINDIIGFRISLQNEEEVEKLAKYFSENLGREYDRVDYFNNPKKNGFKAYLIYFELEGIKFEIQFMTFEMLEFTNLTHDEHDELKYGIKIERLNNSLA